MSRPLLLIICDFLLLSLLAIARFDLPEAGEPADEEAVSREDDAREQELVEVLRLALEAERAEREATASELAETRRELDERMTDLAVREEQVEQLEQRRTELEEDRQQLSEAFERTRQTLASTENRLSTAEERLVETRAEQRAIETAQQATRERLQVIQEELSRREEALAQASENLTELESERSLLEEERRALATELRVREAEKAILAENLQSARTEVQTLRTEKETIQQQAVRLAEGVTSLAESSREIEQRIREGRPSSPNVIYADFLDNRVRVRFEAVFDTLFGTRTETYEAHTVLVRLGGQTYAIVHTDASPFAVDRAAQTPREVRGSLRLGRDAISVNEVRLLRADPRLMAIPVGEETVEAAGIAPVRIERDPLRFADAVVIGQQEGYYGQTAFRIDPGDPGYVVMERKVFSRLLGEFSPARGDLVFSGGGELLGLMATNQLAALVLDAAPLTTIPVSDRYDRETADRELEQARRSLPGN